MAVRSTTKAAPAAKPAAPVAKKATAAAWGISELVDYINAECGTSYDSYNLRIVLRKLVKDEVLDRGEGRYSFKGSGDPQVKIILKAIKSGAAEKAKTERLDSLKAKKAAAKPAVKATVTRTRGKKAVAVVEDEDEDDDLLEDIEDEDDDEE